MLDNNFWAEEVERLYNDGMDFWKAYGIMLQIKNKLELVK